MNRTIRTHYDNLQIAETAGPEVIRGAYKYLSQRWHPDKNPDNHQQAVKNTQAINAAYEVLSDPQRRKQHDIWIAEERQQKSRSAKDHYAYSHESERSDSGTQSPSPTEHKPSTLQKIKRFGLYTLLGLIGIAFVTVVPIQMLNGEWQWSYLIGWAFWLSVAGYAFESLKDPSKRKEEKEKLREKKRTPSRLLRGVLVGAACGLVSFIMFAVFADNALWKSGLFIPSFFVISGAAVGSIALRR